MEKEKNGELTIEGKNLERVVNLEARSIASAGSHDSLFVNPDPSLFDIDVLSTNDMIELTDNLTFKVVKKLHKSSVNEERLVYLVTDTMEGKKFVAVTNAENEHNVLEKLSRGGSKSFPGIKAYSKETYQILIMEFCGENYTQKAKEVSKKDLVALAVDIITQLEALSKFNLVHRNISTRTICQWECGEEDKLGNTLVGFYLVRENNVETNSDVLSKNPLFCSLWVNEGSEYTYSDDLVSLLYVLCYLGKGDLPWFSMKSMLGQKNGKKNFNLVDELPEEFKEFGSAVFKVERGEKPVYGDLLSLLKKIDE